MRKSKYFKFGVLCLCVFAPFSLFLRISVTEYVVPIPSNNLLDAIQNEKTLNEIQEILEVEPELVYEEFEYSGGSVLSALVHKRSDVLRLLVEYGVEPNKPFKLGGMNPNLELPLNYAVEMKSIELTETLLDCGANPNLKGGFGYSAMDIAENYPVQEIAKLLRSRLK